MALPYSFKSFFECDVTADNFVIKVKKIPEVKNIKNTLNGYTIFIKKPNGKKITELKISFDKSKDGFYYSFSLENILKIAIVLIVVLAFVSGDFVRLLKYSAVAIIVLYTGAIWHYKNVFDNFFDKYLNNTFSPEKLSDEQKEWLENPDKCPACGYDLTKYDSFCPECGLNLKNRRKAKKQPASRTGFYDYKITYNFKKNDN